MVIRSRYRGRTRQVAPEQLRPGDMVVAVRGESTAVWPRRQWPTVSEPPYRDHAGDDLVVIVPCSDGGAFYLLPREPVTVAA